MTRAQVPERALILAAGLGSRLRPLTETCPKALMPVFGWPLLDVSTAVAVRSGAKEIAINAHHLGEAVARHLHNHLVPKYPEVEFRLSREETLLGTGGALLALESWMGGQSTYILNADILWLGDLRPLGDALVRGVNAAWMVATGGQEVDLRRVAVKGERVTSVSRTGSPDRHVFTGIHATTADILEHLPEAPCCVMWDGYIPWLNAGATIAAVPTDLPVADTGTPERYIAAHRTFLPHLPALRSLMGSKPFDPGAL